jgi:transcriptional regulator with XRE-family HTH domain
MNDPSSIGPSLRRLRTEQKLALSAVASRAGISVATLSRIETNKQSIEVGLLSTLAGILGVSARDLFGGEDEVEDLAMLSRRIGALSRAERTKVFLESSRRPRDAKQLSPVLDDLVSTVEMLREELLNVQRALRGRGKR